MKTILVLSANPKDTSKLRLDEEVREIQAALLRAKHREQFKIVTSSAIRVDDLRRALLDYQPTILHFSGHGTGSDGLMLENANGHVQLVSTDALTRLFKLFQTNIECVLLNACYSEVQAKAIHEHIDCVIGMNKAIGDVAAIKFATGFYDTLGALHSYEECFEVGCASLDLEGIPESDTPMIKCRRRSSFKVFTGNKAETDMAPKQPPATSRSEISQSINGGRLSGGMQAVQGSNNSQLTTTYNNAAPQERQKTEQTAASIRKLLQNLEQNYPTKTSSDKMMLVAKAVDEIESDASFKSRVVSALSGDIENFKQLINHPLVNILMASLEDWV